jgi:membrane protein
MAIRRLWDFVRAVIGAFIRHRDTQAASAIAYEVLFAIVPMTVLGLAAFGFLMRDPTQRTRLVDLALGALPLQSNVFITDAIRTIANESGALTVVGLVGLVWAATGLFGAIRGALNASWEVRTPRSFLKSKLLDVVAMLGLGLLLAVSVGGTAAIHVWQSWIENGEPNASRVLVPVITAAGYMLPALVTFTAHMLLYRYVPNVKHCARDVWMGALVATLLFECGKNGFTFYIAHLSPNRLAYGAIGDVMLFMLWMWVSANILLVGAEVAATHNRLTCGAPVEARRPDGTPVADDRDAPRAHHA